MDKINVLPAAKSVQKRRLFFLFDIIPAHVRNLTAFIRAKADDLAGQKIQAPLFAKFFAFREEQLKAKTNSQEGFSLAHDIANRLDELEPAKIIHAGVECADAGENDATGRGDFAGLPSDLSVIADPLEALLYAAQ